MGPPQLIKSVDEYVNLKLDDGSTLPVPNDSRDVSGSASRIPNVAPQHLIVRLLGGSVEIV